MKTCLIGIALCCILSSCTGPILAMQDPVCQATAFMGGQEYTVQVYGVREVAHQTEFRAGYPFNWRWVNKNNFTRSNCSK